MKYDAFISYRHLPLDKFVATTLHRTLEGYALPKNLRSPDRKNKIERIFRDQDELPLSSNLSEPIEEALQISDFLIVICTPQLKESKWCIREIETFKRLHGQSHILAVLAEGEPAESFPPQILTEEYTTINEFGNTVIRSRDVEPLAADVRGRSMREIKKKIKAEAIRMVAPMFGVSYDALKQRHRERKLKWMILLASIISSILLVFGIISTAMAITINNQAKIVKAGYSKSLANEAVTAYSEGKLDEALALVDQAASYQQNSAVEAARILTSGIYAPEVILEPAYQIYLDSSVLCMKTSPDQFHLVICDLLGNLSLLDTIDGSLRQIDSYVTMAPNNEDSIQFIDNDRFLYFKTGMPFIYSIADRYSFPISTDYGNAFFSENGSCILQALEGSISIYDTLDYSLMTSIMMPFDDIERVFVSRDGIHLIAFAPLNEKNQTKYCIVDIASKEIVSKDKYIDGIVVGETASDRNFYISATSIPASSDVTRSFICAIDNTGNELWTSNGSSAVYTDIDYCCQDSEEYLYAVNPLGPISLDALSGQTLYAPNVSSMIVSSDMAEDTGKYYMITRDGSLLCFDVIEKSFSEYNNFSARPSLDIAKASLSSNNCFICFNGLDYITAYKPHHRDGCVALTSYDDSNCLASKTPVYELVAFEDVNGILSSRAADILYSSRDKKYYAGLSYTNNQVNIFSDNSKKPLGSIDTKAGILLCAFFSDDNRYLGLSYHNGALEIYDRDSLALVKSIPSGYQYVQDMMPMTNGRYLIETMYKSYIVDSAFEQLWSLEKNANYQLLDYGIETEKFVGSCRGKIYEW